MRFLAICAALLLTMLWYGINRSNREPAQPTKMPKGQLRDVAAGLAEYRRNHARLLQYVRTTKDALRPRIVQRPTRRG